MKWAQNVYKNLNENGYFIFDVYNYDRTKDSTDFLDKLIDNCVKKDNVKAVRFCYRKLNTRKRVMRLK